MRQVTQTITDAVTVINNTKSSARCTIYKSRTYFDTYIDKSFVGAPIVGELGYPISEAVTYVESIEKFVTVIINDDGNIALLIEGSATPIVPTIYDIPLDTEIWSRPGIFGNKIFYRSQTTIYDSGSDSGGDYGDYGGTDINIWKCAEFDADLLESGEPECITSNIELTYVPTGAAYPVSTDEVVILYIDEGSIRTAFIASDGSVHLHPGRFINPTNALDELLEEDLYTTHYAGAVLKEDTVYIYFTTHYGSVKVIKYKLSPDGINGIWSDQLVAIPEDLSTFNVSNVILIEDRIFICGQFFRNEEYETGTKYTLMCWSDDGVTFSLDRRTLVTPVDLRFQAVMCDDSIVYTASNRYNKELAPYQLIGETCPQTMISLRGITGSPQSGWNMEVVSGNEIYLDDLNIDVGNYAKLEIGIETSNGTEWIKYHDVIISGITKGFEDGSRVLNIQAMPDGMWHISSMTHPFYMEMQGKQSHFDPLDDLHNMYKANSSAGPIWALSCDFWTSDYDSSGLGWQTHAGATTTDHWGRDLVDLCNAYPIFGNAATYEIKIYGWSRAGVPSTNETHRQVSDSTPTTTKNDDFYALLLVEDANGNQSEVVSLIEELTSSYSNPPQTYFPAGARSGSDPVVYSIANPGEGWKIIKLGARVISDTGNTTYYLSRIEMPEITADLIPLSVEVEEVEPAELNRDAFLHTIGSDVGWPHNDNVYGDPCFFSEGPHGAGYMGEIQQAVSTLLESTTIQVQVTATFYCPSIDTFSYEGGHREYGAHIYHKNKYGTTLASYAMENQIINDGASYYFVLTHVFSNVKKEDYFTTELGSGLSQGPYWDTKTWTLTTSIYVVEQDEATQEELPPIISVISNKKKGIPQIFFSSRPYSAWNFDLTLQTSFIGIYTLTGLLGLATDKNNFITAYIRNGYCGIAKVRNGRRIVLYEMVDASLVPDTSYDIRFWHRNGLFGLEYKEIGDPWPSRGSQLSYMWTFEDEQIAMADDIFHVGIYHHIDPPRFRTTGFRSSQPVVPVMPLDLDPIEGDSDFETDFPSSGTIDIEGIKYTYTGKVTFSAGDDFPIGPVQLRNIYEWNPPFNKEVDNSYTYPGGIAIEVTEFRYLAGVTGHDDFEGAIIGSNSGYCWVNDEVQWKAWITTAGSVVKLHERSRHYSPLIPEYYASTSEKIYITNGLTGITPSEDEIGNVSDEVQYPEGTFVYLDSNDAVRAANFFASNGDHDQSVSSLLDKFCKLAGTKAVFNGDISPIIPGGGIDIATPLELL